MNMKWGLKTGRTGIGWQVVAGTISIPAPTGDGRKGEVVRMAGGFTSVAVAMVVEALDFTASARCLRCSMGTRRWIWLGSLGWR